MKSIDETKLSRLVSGIDSQTRFWTLMTVAIAGCGSAPHTERPTDLKDPTAVVAPVRPPLQLEVKVLTARGDVAVRMSDDGAWQPLAAGASLAGVREIRALRRGAIISLGHGDAAGRLWLRGGSTVRLGQDAAGVHVEVVAGRARVRRPASALTLSADVASGAVPVEGDVVLEAARMVPTGARPELAEFSLRLDGTDEGAGVGRMEIRDTAERAEQLALSRVTVDVHTAGDFAITEVDHVFTNAGDTNREGTFRFPVPDGALLTGLAMEIDGKLVEGEIVEREKAREVYDKIVDEMRDPALLEWEEGNWFKLRVFPIEAHKDKRVVIRYASPLARGAAGFEYDFALAAPEQAIGELTVKVDGVIVDAERTVTSGLDLVVPLGDDKVPAVMRETRSDGVYTAVRIPAPKDLAAAPHGPRKVVVIADTSRSALEGKPLELELVKTALAELGPADSFVVLAADITARPHAPKFVPVTPDAIATAVAFVDAIEPDGASDLATALAAAKALAPTDVIYVGDGIPTWGERNPAPLAALAAGIHAPIHAALVGKGASTELWSGVAGATGGRALIVRRAVDARRFALAATHAADVPRLADARVEVADSVVFPAQATTLYSGDELLALVRTPADKPAPTSLVLKGTANGKPMTQTIALAKPIATQHVMQRWAAFQLAALDSAGAPREDIVALSRDAGLMSRYTSLLVLENDEAYKKYQIERRQQTEQVAKVGDPKITGGDLDSLGAARPSLSPDEIQPGDPEIKIPAPRDARSVVVTFPFGETKVAMWDADVGAWMVRFLIDKDTADGEYQVRVTVTHADGHLELMKLPYTVDTKPPAVELKVTYAADGYRIKAVQKQAQKDADRVEVVLPDGTILALTQLAWGKFEGTWTTAPLASPVTLRVVIRDRALNQSVTELLVGN